MNEMNDFLSLFCVLLFLTVFDKYENNITDFSQQSKKANVKSTPEEEQ
jgi:hypothetical protein